MSLGLLRMSSEAGAGDRNSGPSESFAQTFHLHLLNQNYIGSDCIPESRSHASLPSTIVTSSD